MDKMDTLPPSLPARPHQVISRVDGATRRWLRKQARESKVSISEVIYRRLLLARQITERRSALTAQSAAEAEGTPLERRQTERRGATDSAT